MYKLLIGNAGPVIEDTTLFTESDWNRYFGMYMGDPAAAIGKTNLRNNRGLLVNSQGPSGTLLVEDGENNYSFKDVSREFIDMSEATRFCNVNRVGRYKRIIGGEWSHTGTNLLINKNFHYGSGGYGRIAPGESCDSLYAGWVINNPNDVSIYIGNNGYIRAPRDKSVVISQTLNPCIIGKTKVTVTSGADSVFLNGVRMERNNGHHTWEGEPLTEAPMLSIVVENNNYISGVGIDAQ